MIFHICGECSAKFETFQACEDHANTHVSKCFKYDFKSDDKKKLKDHERTEHDLLKCNGNSHKEKCKIVPQTDSKQEKEYKNKSNTETQSFLCEQCNKTFDSEVTLKTHDCNIKCEQCEFVSVDIQTMVSHIRDIHGQPLFCNFCDFHGVTRGELAKHTFEYHEDQTILNTISDQVSDLSNSFASFEVFKEELKDVLLGIIQGQNTMKQELFLIRNHQVLSSPQPYIYTRSEPTTKTPASSSKTTTFPDNLEHTPLPPPGYSVRTPPSHTGHSKHTPRTLPDNSACAPPPPSSTSTPTPQAPRNTPKAPKQETERSRILFIGDSISANIDINALENATQKGFVTAKAYSSVFDTVTNAAKKAARFPNSNFTDAIPAQLRKSKFHSLILQAGSVD